MNVGQFTKGARGMWNQETQARQADANAKMAYGNGTLGESHRLDPIEKHRESELTSVVQHLLKVKDVLDGRLSQLEERLQMVLRPSSPSGPQVAHGEPPRTYQTQLGTGLNELVTRTAMQVERVSSMLDRLEL